MSIPTCPKCGNPVIYELKFLECKVGCEDCNMAIQVLSDGKDTPDELIEKGYREWERRAKR